MRTADQDSRSRMNFERALYSLSDGLALIQDEHVVFWNPRAQALFGFPPEEMIGRRTDELAQRLAARSTSPDSTFERLEKALASIAGLHSVDIELAPLVRSRLVDEPAPHVRFVLAEFFPVAELERQQPGTGILMHDVTRDREADASKSQLLSTVSHELRTPLASIKGFATTLLRQDVRWDDATQRDFLRIIEEEADRLTEIIDNLLDMSQLEAGVLRVEKEPIQIRTIIRDVVDEMRMRTEAHWFVVDLPTDLPLVLADSRRIRQVLHNLLENAVKYSKNGQITVNCETQSDFVLVSVSDQGEGIPPEYLNLIFERFFQVDGASTRRVGGSGLGLSISRGIILAHGGKIWVESERSKGSTFRFTLPLAPPELDM